MAEAESNLSEAGGKPEPTGPAPLRSKVSDMTFMDTITHLGKRFNEKEKKRWFSEPGGTVKVGLIRTKELDTLVRIFTETYDFSKKLKPYAVENMGPLLNDEEEKGNIHFDFELSESERGAENEEEGSGSGSEGSGSGGSDNNGSGSEGSGSEGSGSGSEGSGSGGSDNNGSGSEGSGSEGSGSEGSGSNGSGSEGSGNNDEENENWEPNGSGSEGSGTSEGSGSSEPRPKGKGPVRKPRDALQVIPTLDVLPEGWPTYNINPPPLKAGQKASANQKYYSTIIKHQHVRFAQLYNILVTQPTARVIIASSLDKKTGIRKPALGIGLAVGQWGDASLSNANTANLTALSNYLVKTFPGRAVLGNVGKPPGSADFPVAKKDAPSNTVYHVWGANIANWDNIAIGGGGQAAAFGNNPKQIPGIFGVITTPTAIPGNMKKYNTLPTNLTGNIVGSSFVIKAPAKGGGKEGEGEEGGEEEGKGENAGNKGSVENVGPRESRRDTNNLSPENIEAIKQLGFNFTDSLPPVELNSDPATSKSASDFDRLYLGWLKNPDEGLSLTERRQKRNVLRSIFRFIFGTKLLNEVTVSKMVKKLRIAYTPLSPTEKLPCNDNALWDDFRKSLMHRRKIAMKELGATRDAIGERTLYSDNLKRLLLGLRDMLIILDSDTYPCVDYSFDPSLMEDEEEEKEDYARILKVFRNFIAKKKLFDRDGRPPFPTLNELQTNLAKKGRVPEPAELLYRQIVQLLNFRFGGAGAQERIRELERDIQMMREDVKELSYLVLFLKYLLELSIKIGKLRLGLAEIKCKLDECCDERKKAEAAIQAELENAENEQNIANNQLSHFGRDCPDTAELIHIIQMLTYMLSLSNKMGKLGKGLAEIETKLCECCERAKMGKISEGLHEIMHKLDDCCENRRRLLGIESQLKACEERLKAKEEESAKTQALLLMARNAQQAAEEERTRIEQQLEELRRQLGARIRQLEDEKDVLEEELEATQADLDRTDRQLDNEIEHSNQLQRRINDIERELEDCHGQLGRARANVQEAQENAARRIGEAERAAGERVAAAQAERDAAEERARRMRADADREIAEARRLEGEARDAREATERGEQGARARAEAAEAEAREARDRAQAAEVRAADAERDAQAARVNADTERARANAADAQAAEEARQRAQANAARALADQARTVAEGVAAAQTALAQAADANAQDAVRREAEAQAAQRQAEVARAQAEADALAAQQQAAAANAERDRAQQAARNATNAADRSRLQAEAVARERDAAQANEVAALAAADAARIQAQQTEAEAARHIAAIQAEREEALATARAAVAEAAEQRAQAEAEAAEAAAARANAGRARGEAAVAGQARNAARANAETARANAREARAAHAAEIEARRNEAAANARALQELRDENARIQGDLDDAVADLGMAREDIDLLHAQARERDTTHEEYRREQERAMRALGDSLRETQEARAAAERRAANAEGRVEEQEAEKRALEARVLQQEEQIRGLRDRQVEVEAEMTRLRADNAAKAREIARLQALLDEAQRTGGDAADALRALRAQLAAAREAHRRDIAEAEARLRAQLEAQREALQAEAEREKDELAADLDEVHQAALAAQKGIFDKLKASIQAELDAARALNAQLQATVRQQQGALANAERNMARLRDATRAQREAEEAAARAREAEEAEAARRRALQAEREAAERERARLEEERRRLQREANNAAERDRLEAERARLQREAEAAAAERARLERERREREAAEAAARAAASPPAAGGEGNARSEEPSVEESEERLLSTKEEFIELLMGAISDSTKRKKVLKSLITQFAIFARTSRDETGAPIGRQIDQFLAVNPFRVEGMKPFTTAESFWRESPRIDEQGIIFQLSPEGDPIVLNFLVDAFVDLIYRISTTAEYGTGAPEGQDIGSILRTLEIQEKRGAATPQAVRQIESSLDGAFAGAGIEPTRQAALKSELLPALYAIGLAEIGVIAARRREGRAAAAPVLALPAGIQRLYERMESAWPTTGPLVTRIGYAVRTRKDIPKPTKLSEALNIYILLLKEKTAGSIDGMIEELFKTPAQRKFWNDTKEDLKAIAATGKSIPPERKRVWGGGGGGGVQSGGGKKEDEVKSMCDTLLTLLFLEAQQHPGFDAQAFLDKAGMTLDELGQCPLVLDMLNRLIDATIDETPLEDGYRVKLLDSNPFYSALETAYNTFFSGIDKQILQSIGAPLAFHAQPPETYNELFGGRSYLLNGVPRKEDTPLRGFSEEDEDDPITLTKDEQEVIERGGAGISLGGLLFLYLACLRELHDTGESPTLNSKCPALRPTRSRLT